MSTIRSDRRADVILTSGLGFEASRLLHNRSALSAPCQSIAVVQRPAWLNTTGLLGSDVVHCLAHDAPIPPGSRKAHPDGVRRSSGLDDGGGSSRMPDRRDRPADSRCHSPADWRFDPIMKRTPRPELNRKPGRIAGPLALLILILAGRPSFAAQEAGPGPAAPAKKADASRPADKAPRSRPSRRRRTSNRSRSSGRRSATDTTTPSSAGSTGRPSTTSCGRRSSGPGP